MEPAPRDRARSTAGAMGIAPRVKDEARDEAAAVAAVRAAKEWDEVRVK